MMFLFSMSKHSTIIKVVPANNDWFPKGKHPWVCTEHDDHYSNAISRGLPSSPQKLHFVRTTEKCVSCNFIPELKSLGLASFQDPPGVLHSLHPLQNMDQRWIVQFQKKTCFDMSWPLQCSGLSDFFWNKDCATVHPSFLAKGMCITDPFTAPNQARALQPDPSGERLPRLRRHELNLPRKMCASGSNPKKRLVMLL